MKKVFIIEENDVEELIKNANITEAILSGVLNDDKVDQGVKDQLIKAKFSINIVNSILAKDEL